MDAHNHRTVFIVLLEVTHMPQEWEEENIFGEADGSSYSAVLGRSADGHFTLRSLLIDGHNVPVMNAAWPSREEAVQAVRDYAQGNQRP
nr:hypothetical protein [uncultured Acidovorax sp.]